MTAMISLIILRPRNANLRDLPITAGNTVGVALGALGAMDVPARSNRLSIQLVVSEVPLGIDPSVGHPLSLVVILNLASLLILSDFWRRWVHRVHFKMCFVRDETGEVEAVSNYCLAHSCWGYNTQSNPLFTEFAQCPHAIARIVLVNGSSAWMAFVSLILLLWACTVSSKWWNIAAFVWAEIHGCPA